MKNSLADGKRLIELPKKTVDLVKLDFSQEERETLYDGKLLSLKVMNV